MKNNVPSWIRGAEAKLLTDNLNKLLKDNKIKRRELAELLEVSEGQVSKLCSGENNLSLDKLVALHYSLGVDLNYFLARNDNCSMFMKNVESDRLKRIDYLLENALIEIEKAPEGEHAQILTTVYILFGKS